MDIYIYSTDACNKCRMLKDALSDAQITYVEKDAIKEYDDIKDSWMASAPIVKIVTEDGSKFYDLEWCIKFLKDEGLL